VTHAEEDTSSARRGERLFTAPLTIEPISAIPFSRGAVAHVFTAHAQPVAAVLTAARRSGA
jgi:hypothetical protein